VFQLAKLGIKETNIHFGSVTMSSDKSVIVREVNGDSAQVAIIDVANPTAVVRRSISADSALMNPTENILALKCKSAVLVVSCALPDLVCAFQPEETCRSSTSTTSRS